MPRHSPSVGLVDAIGDEDMSYGWLSLLSDLWKYVRPYRGLFLVAALFRFASDMVWLYPAWALGEITNFFAGYHLGQPLDYFIYLMVLWVVVGVFHFTGREVCKYYGFQVGERIGLDARIAAVKHLFKLDIMWHEREYSGSKLKRISNGADGLTEIVRMFYVNIIEAAVSLVGITLILFSFDVELSIMLLFFIVTYYLLSFKLSQKASAQSRRVNQQEEMVEGVSFESVSNINTIKTLGVGEAVLLNIVSSTRTLMDEIRRRILYFRLREVVLTNYSLLFRFACMLYIGFGIYAGRFDVGILIMFYAYFDRVLQATTEMSTVTDQLLVRKVELGRLRAMMDVKPTIEVDGKGSMRLEWSRISVSSLSFSYGERHVLKNLSFTVKRGERVGIIGPSGAGKSTLFKLLLKLHERYDGDILVDDTPLREIDRSSYMEKVAVVLQETEVFNMSLKDNIEIVGGDERNLEKALKTANLEEVVERLREGVNTIIGEKGVKLSVGEKQRLGIARAVYKNPDILFLDEATSHLDANSEAKIKDSLKQVFQNVTAIVIAHRLSTIREMDRILVIDKGVLVEEGGFEELIERGGLFYNLWQKQKL